MKLLQRFETNHVDLIHDLAYDYCGKRLATCSSDQTIKIWDNVDNEWKLVRARALLSRQLNACARCLVSLCVCVSLSICVCARGCSKKTPDHVVEGA
jgi:WD40 repeat protein